MLINSLYLRILTNVDHLFSSKLLSEVQVVLVGFLGLGLRFHRLSSVSVDHAQEAGRDRLGLHGPVVKDGSVVLEIGVPCYRPCC